MKRKFVFAYKMPDISELEEITDEFGRTVPFIPVPESNAYIVLLEYDTEDAGYKATEDTVTQKMIPVLGLGFKQLVTAYDYEEFMRGSKEPGYTPKPLNVIKEVVDESDNSTEQTE